MQLCSQFKNAPRIRVLLLLQAIFQGVHPGMVARLDIRVRREHIMQDALNQLTGRGSELGKPLRVSQLCNLPLLLCGCICTVHWQDVKG